uniref:hypothetical protein n=1 Tax=Streptomyces sp. CB02009 TaxID=1703938 RepID=UPI001F5270DB|nr:hypothetical protein [Streptomyces sp. CB02009]
MRSLFSLEEDWPYAELVGGPLDRLLVDITGWTADTIADGAALITEAGAFGPGGPRPVRAPRRRSPGPWEWTGDTP